MENKPINKANDKALAWFITFIIVAGYLVYNALFGGSSTATNTPATNINIATSTTSNKPAFELLSSNFRKDDYSKYVVGMIRNTSGKDLSYVQVEINLYDRSGRQIGSTIDNTLNLANGGTWSFKAIVLEGDEAKKYRVINISGR